MKIFGREPALWVAGINSIIVIAGTLGLSLLTTNQATLWTALIDAIAAVAMALLVRPISPAVFTYLITAIVALAAGYGFNVPEPTVVTVNLAVVPLLTLIFRGQVSPQSTAVSKA